MLPCLSMNAPCCTQPPPTAFFEVAHLNAHGVRMRALQPVSVRGKAYAPGEQFMAHHEDVAELARYGLAETA